MEFFYIVVSVLAVIILILALTFIGLMIQNGNKTQKFPPNMSQCPDLWIPDGSYCHYNGLNNGTYVTYDKGVETKDSTNEGKFLGDKKITTNGTYVDKYDFSQIDNTYSKKPLKNKLDNGRITKIEPIMTYPMNTAPFFTYGGTINTNSTTINPYDPQWGTSGLSANCAKKKWAKLNNIEWSGITQLNTC